MNSLTTSAKPIATPHYVLLNGKTRIAPTVLQLSSGQDCSALYGFSDKAPYDLFRAASDLALTPFPLVKVYLRTLLDANESHLHLVIMDAASPSQQTVQAATMQSILDAQLAQAPNVIAEYSLTFDEQANGYRIDENDDSPKACNPSPSL